MCDDEAESTASTGVSGAPATPTETSSVPEPEPTPPQESEPTPSQEQQAEPEQREPEPEPVQKLSLVKRSARGKRPEPARLMDPNPEPASQEHPEPIPAEAPAPAAATAPAPAPAAGGDSAGPELSIAYFRRLLASETERLSALAGRWEAVAAAGGLPAEPLGEVRSVTGQARLLIRERFVQFDGLVDGAEFLRGPRPTTLTDLQGFWEMIYFQVGVSVTVTRRWTGAVETGVGRSSRCGRRVVERK